VKVIYARVEGVTHEAVREIAALARLPISTVVDSILGTAIGLPTPYTRAVNRAIRLRKEQAGS